MEEIAQKLYNDLKQDIDQKDGDRGVVNESHLKYLSQFKCFRDIWNKIISDNK